MEAIISSAYASMFASSAGGRPSASSATPTIGA